MRQEKFLAAACLACAAVDRWSAPTFEGTELSGGTLFLIRENAGGVFLLALILVFKFPRVASISALLGSVFSLPLYLYLVLPRPFQRIWPGQFSVAATENFRWDTRWITGILFMLVSSYISTRLLIDSHSAAPEDARTWQKLLLATTCLAGCVVGIKSFFVWEGTEFGSGSLAGNKDLGLFLFALAMLVVIKYPRAASVIALMACWLSLPLYLYFVFPRPFRLTWPGPWKVLSIPSENFKWNAWWIAALFSLLLSAVISCRLLFSSPKPPIPNPQSPPSPTTEHPQSPSPTKSA